MTQMMHDPSRTAEDGWTSDRWADPSTQAAPWGPSLRDLPPPAALTPAPPRTSPWPRPWVAVGIVLLALLVGIGATRLLVGTEPAARTATPPAAAPAQPSAPSDPNATDPNATDPNAAGQGQDPGAAGQLPGSQPGAGADDQQGAQTDRTLSATAAKVAPSIVDINTTVGYDGAQAAGTGEILTEDGYVITNHHVIAGSTEIEVVVTATGQKYAADVVGYDTSHDIAVIKMRDASGLTPAPFGDSSTVKLGDKVIGLGNAGGVGGTPIEAAGTVTGLGRSITATDESNGTSERLHDLIETDADIKPGDSGGSLIDADGKVVGIITAGSVSASVSGQSDTDGYAVPINQALAIAQDIRDGKASDTIHIGASAFLGVQAAGSGSGGVTIKGTVDGSAAEKAGLGAGDTITKVDGRRISSANDLRAALAPHHPGDQVSITWTGSDGRSTTRTVTLGEGPVG